MTETMNEKETAKWNEFNYLTNESFNKNVNDRAEKIFEKIAETSNGIAYDLAIYGMSTLSLDKNDNIVRLDPTKVSYNK